MQTLSELIILFSHQITEKLIEYTLLSKNQHSYKVYGLLFFFYELKQMNLNKLIESNTP